MKTDEIKAEKSQGKNALIIQALYSVRDLFLFI